MKTPQSSSRRTRASCALAFSLSLFGVVAAQGAPPDPDADPQREPGLGERVIKFFRSIGDRDESRQRRADVPPSEPGRPPRANLDQPAPGTDAVPSRSIASRVHAASQPANVQVAPASEPTTPLVAKKKSSRPSSNGKERDTTQQSESSPPAANPESSEPNPAPQGRETTQRELAELKRKVAAMEAELANANGQKTPGTATPSSPGDSDIKLTAPPPANLPPRGPTTLPANAPKKSFAGETPVTTSTTPNVNATPTSAPAPPGNSDTPPDASGSSSAVPVGTKTTRPGIVKSPHPPYNDIDVNGLQKGTLAKDPTTQKIFRVP